MSEYQKILNEAMKYQPILNIGMIGSVANGKSSITKALTGISTQKHSSEKQKNITIKLGYANAKIYKCQMCPKPECYQSGSSNLFSKKCTICDSEMDLITHISLVDCFHPSTKVIMFDGSIKSVSDIKCNDFLMGPDGKSRKVLNICEGVKELYEIKYKDNGFKCTGGHLLVLILDTPVCPPSKFNNQYIIEMFKYENKKIKIQTLLFEDIISAEKFFNEQQKKPIIFEITVETYINLSNSFKSKMKLFRPSAIEFDVKPSISISIRGSTDEEIAWLIGLWLANGNFNASRFTIRSNETEIIDKLKTIANKIGLKTLVKKYDDKKIYYTIYLKLNDEMSNKKYNLFTNLLNKFNLLKNKHIDSSLMFQNLEIRKALLAGFLDGDGYYKEGHFEILQDVKNKSLIDGLLWICRSIGLTADVSTKHVKNKKDKQLKLYCYGNTSGLPICKKKGRECINSRTLSQSFEIITKGYGKFKGFEVDNDGRFLLNDFIVAHNCPGHISFMSTMINGTNIMDTTILVEAINNDVIPAPQTKEHLNAITVGNIPNSIICLNKFDLVKNDLVMKKINILENELKNTIAKNSPMIPLSATLGINIDVLCDYISQIPIPIRDISSPPKMLIVRSFNINKPRINIDNLCGGVIGGSILYGKINNGMDVKLCPGYCIENKVKSKNKCRWKYKPLRAKILSINSETNKLEYAIPGGLIGVQLDIDPALTANDGLVGQILTPANCCSGVYEDIAISYKLLDNFSSVNVNDKLQLNINACNVMCEVKKIYNDEHILVLQLKKPISVNIKDKVTICFNGKIFGMGEIIDGKKSEEDL